MADDLVCPQCGGTHVGSPAGECPIKNPPAPIGWPKKADDLVVREWTAGDKYYVPPRYWHEHNALARAYLERAAQLAAQLAAMTAERDAIARSRDLAMAERDEWKRRAADFEARWMNADAVAKEVLGKLTASEAARERLTRAVEEARDVFKGYAAHHLGRSSYTKADANRALANRMILALAEPGKAGEP